jgi:hypothetical protein
MFARSVPLVTLALTLAALISGCGGSDSTPENSQAFTQKNIAELQQLAPDDAKGAKVDGVVGQVSQVTRNGDGTTLVVYTDAESIKDQVLVLTDNASVEKDDFIKVSGQVQDFSKSKNAIGTEVELPRIAATSLEPTTSAALDPPLQTIRIGQTKNLAGVLISVVRAEISKKQVRISVRYKNKSDQVFASVPSLTAEGEQIDSAYSEDIKDPATTVSPGAKTAGVLVFEAAEPQSRFTLSYDGYNSNFKKVNVKFRFGG